ncbi:MAG: hypothetical protein NC210_02205 [[Clostridium] fimetarium]|nr:hypothetical protein [Alistipes timonensis]MCM1405213.1 hypothetical protein [[Clostridium] fimetarium]
MRDVIKSILLLAAATPFAASADGFLPYGGYAAGEHYAVETLASGFASEGDAVLSHGSLPVASTHTSGVEEIAAEGAALSVSVSADGCSLLVDGLSLGAAYDIIAIDGRRLASGRVASTAIDISRLQAGQYLLRIANEGSAPVVYNFLKRG